MTYLHIVSYFLKNNVWQIFHCLGSNYIWSNDDELKNVVELVLEVEVVSSVRPPWHENQLIELLAVASGGLTGWLLGTLDIGGKLVSFLWHRTTGGLLEFLDLLFSLIWILILVLMIEWYYWDYTHLRGSLLYRNEMTNFKATWISACMMS